MTNSETYICYAGRTAVGKLGGAFANTPAPRLAAPLIKDALNTTKLDCSAVDEIIMGSVLSAGVGQAPARQAAIYGGLAESVCATTVNRVCGSGIKAVMLGDQAIRLGDANLIIAGGMESMTLAPHLIPKARAGYKFGGFEVRDHMQFDGLWDPYGDVPMGNCGEICADKYEFSREAQDGFSITSYQRARSAVENGDFDNELVPVTIKTRKGEMVVSKDEEPFSVDLEKLPKLRTAFTKEGTITAGNASSINDGAALVVLASQHAVNENDLKPLAKITGQASFAHSPEMFTTAPIGCIEKLLKSKNLTVEDIDLWEINEAFAVVTMAAMAELNIPHEKVNVNGGAVSIGHPIGCSGTRVLVTLIHAMKARGAKTGIACLCIGGGEASSVMVELV